MRRKYFNKLKSLILKDAVKPTGIIKLYILTYRYAEFRHLEGRESIVIYIRGKHFEIMKNTLNISYFYNNKERFLNRRTLKNWYNLLTK